jgi:hypothetical protein
MTTFGAAAYVLLVLYALRENNWSWPLDHSTPVSRMMAQAHLDAASAAWADGQPPSGELSFIRDFAAPDDWVCHFWGYEAVNRVVRRETGRRVSANSTRVGDSAAWALVVGDRAHVALIRSMDVDDRRKNASRWTDRRCTPVSETAVFVHGQRLVLRDAN